MRWADEELASMAREELRLVANDCRKLNIELAKIFPQRTLEGVKRMRRNAKYKSLLSSFQAPSAALPGPSPSLVVGCDEESRGSTLASSPNDIVTGSIVPENIVDLTEGGGLPLPRSRMRYQEAGMTSGHLKVAKDLM